MSKPSSTSRAKAYAKAGVDIVAGNTLVRRIKKYVAQTHTHSVLSEIGGFGGLFKPDMENIESPVLVASTDGVGTKLKLASAFNHHSSVGIDLVAMSVNDILVQGAKPLFFLDYFATGKLDLNLAETVIAGIAEGCKQAGCALLGGETAEMPDMYAPGEYDLAGFCVGLVGDSDLVDGSSVKVGDRIIGIASSGPHANGYSLIRKLLDESGLNGQDRFPGTEQTVRDVLLEPTIIYADCLRNLRRDFPISGMVHITGGGFYDNIPRVLPAQVKGLIHFGAWDIPPVFSWIMARGKLSWPEMLQIFNCGIGFIVIVDPGIAEDVVRRIDALRLKAWDIGLVERQTSSADDRLKIIFNRKKSESE
ncbi:MAG: phosphoribosylformylglycinamidine cyclo-ligase [Deltaproteobacteria bacterium]|jgi:phosphoribosylformylglycinamidine cyclo-ligase|nr:phosphoribosylformylglycinamidine cyclo-ligase [Deltaproteobacteria bacterium]